MRKANLALGFLANVLGLLTIVLVIYLGLTVFGLFFATIGKALQAEFIGSPPGDSGRQVVDSLLTMLRGIWDLVPGFLIFGLLGMFAAWGDEMARALDKKRAWLGSLGCMAVIITVSVITWRFVQREEIALWMAEAPETFGWRDLLVGSYTTDVVMSLAFVLVVTYPIWAVWRWWYAKLVGWLMPSVPMPKAAARRTALEEQMAYASRLHELKRGTLAAEGRVAERSDVSTKAAPTLQSSPLKEMWQGGKLIKPLAILFILCVVLLVAVNWYHTQVAVRIQHSIVYVAAVGSEGPHQSRTVKVEPGTRKIRVVNVNGTGTVNLYLSPTNDYREAVAGMKNWSFEWRPDEYLYADIPLAEVQPGEYYLHFVQDSGWGYFEYTLASGGGTASQLSALALGFLLACSLILGLVLLLLTTARIKRRR